MFLPCFPIYFLSVVSNLFLPCSIAVNHSLYLSARRDAVLPLFHNSLRINTVHDATTIYYFGLAFRNLLFRITMRILVIRGVFFFFLSCFPILS